MDIGIAFPSYIDAWREVQAAEEAGFTHAWFFDSQLIYSDVYATMALAAQHTSRIRLGTLVAIPTNRIAPVTASAIATINKLAPGRVTLAMGTGYTGRNTMGLNSVPVSMFKEYTQQVGGLLRGEDVLFREGAKSAGLGWSTLTGAASSTSKTPYRFTWRPTGQGLSGLWESLPTAG